MSANSSAPGDPAHVRLKPTVIVTIYAAAFLVLHPLAAAWGQLSIYSIWYPIAGVRFALLWRFGPKLSAPFAAADLLAHLVWGDFPARPLQAATFAASIVLPPLAYGLAIATLKALRRRAGGKPSEDAVALAVGMAFAPALASISSLPWAFFDGRALAVTTLLEQLGAVLVFLVGDVLGVLLIAPPLLWLFGLRDPGREDPFQRVSPAKLAEACAVVALAALAAWISQNNGLGLRLEPMLLATAWVGLRLGAATAWIVIAGVSAYVLFLLPANTEQSVRIALHMLTASLAVEGYVVGSFSDAHERHLQEIARKDRLLMHAERLKTLRAMSVAIIHELAQPLSVLAIEAKTLREISRAPTIDQQELKAVAHLIERKSANLADLARRLRGFGERGVAERAPIDLQALLQDAVAIVRPEAKAANVTVRLRDSSEARIEGAAVELQQAVVNLLRNAVAAAPGEEVMVASRRNGSVATIQIDNPVRNSAESPNGMGIGLIIAKTIVEAHGGQLQQTEAHGGVRYSIRLPIHCEPHAQ